MLPFINLFDLEKQIPRPKSRVFSLNLEKMENQQANSPTEARNSKQISS